MLLFFFTKPISASAKTITAAPYDPSPSTIHGLKSLTVGKNEVKVQKSKKGSGIKFIVPEDGNYTFSFSDFECDTKKDTGTCFQFGLFNPEEKKAHEYKAFITPFSLYLNNCEGSSDSASFETSLKKEQILYIYCDPSAKYPMKEYLYEAYSFQLEISSSSVDERDKETGISSAAKFSQKITYHTSSIKKGKVVFGSSFSLNAKTSGKGKLTYKSSNSKILSVNAKGKVAVKGYGQAYIRIKASGGNGYKAAVRKFKLTAVPARGKVTKAVQENDIVRFKWKEEKAADGYEYVTAYNSKFSGQSKKKTKNTGLALTKYKTGTKKMFFKVRVYKKVGKKNYYGSWSKVRSLKLKKARKAGEPSYVIAK